jgi:multiple antibiotic resistance protein
VLVPVTLLPIINPLTTAPVFVATVGTDRVLAAKLARQVAINSWFVVVTSILIGSYALALFGISLPVVRIGGAGAADAETTTFSARAYPSLVIADRD